jgi:DNA repair protein RadA/Sms
MVAGSIILLGGDPGIGKSTLMLQLCVGAKGLDSPVLFVSGEESLAQIRLRAERLGALNDNVLVMSETSVPDIIAAAEHTHPSVLIIDSIQTMCLPELQSTAGSISQVRESAAEFQRYAKSRGVPVFLIGHVTKDGYLAGPRVLEHMVDTVLQFEGDSRHAYRIVRCVKNRFGSTNEIGVFEMLQNGLREVPNPSEIFLAQRARNISGCCVAACMEGSRALLVEVQALVTPSNYGVPQRTVAGIDAKRLSLLLAVLEKRFGMPVGRNDVFVNITGGVRVDEPAADLAVLAAVVSSFKDVPLDAGLAFMGELGLGGEVRPVSFIDRRVSELEKLGFQKAVVPKGNIKDKRSRGIQLVEVAHFLGVMREVFG